MDILVTILSLILGAVGLGGGFFIWKSKNKEIKNLEEKVEEAEDNAEVSQKQLDIVTDRTTNTSGKLRKGKF